MAQATLALASTSSIIRFIVIPDAPITYESSRRPVTGRRGDSDHLTAESQMQTPMPQSRLRPRSVPPISAALILAAALGQQSVLRPLTRRSHRSPHRADGLELGPPQGALAARAGRARRSVPIRPRPAHSTSSSTSSIATFSAGTSFPSLLTATSFRVASSSSPSARRRVPEMSSPTSNRSSTIAGGWWWPVA